MPLRFKTNNFDIEVKYKPAGNELLVPEPQIRMRTVDGKMVQKVRTIAKKRFQWCGKDLAVDMKLTDPETQKEVPISGALEILDHYQYRLLDEEGNLWKEEEIRYYAVKEDGSEMECSPYERTKVIEIPDENWVPSTATDDFLFHNIYEIFSEDKKIAQILFEEAEKRYKADQVGIATFSFGGFIQYYAFLVPMVRDGKFVWLMKLTQKAHIVQVQMQTLAYD